MTLALQATGITKRFPSVLAGDHVNFALERGENGAGKSTLMNILYGFYQPDEGEICIQDQPVKITSPHDAIKKGVGMVHQHFMLVPPLTVTENIMLGKSRPLRVRGLLENWQSWTWRAVSRRVCDLSRQYNIEVDSDAVVRNLTVGAQQRVEIIKALYRDADILILDEPTAVLTPQEADELFVVMHNLIRGGIVGFRSEPRGGGTSLEQGSCEPNPAADRDTVIAGFDTLISATYEDK